MLISEEASCIIYSAFSKVENLLVEDEKYRNNELSDDVIQTYELSGYRTEEALKEYLLTDFSAEIYDYYLEMAMIMGSIWYEPERKIYLFSLGGDSGEGYLSHRLF